MTDRRGFSLVEMVIVLVLAGLVSTAAITMFSTQNRLNAAMTALGESQENARSAVQMVASELRSVDGSNVVTAHSREVAFVLPVAKGIVCAQRGGGFIHVYFPMNGRVLDLREDVDRKAFFDGEAWSIRVLSGADRFQGVASRVPCVDNGMEAIGTDGDYATLRGNAPVGSVVALVRLIAYTFDESTLGSDRVALYRERNREMVELASGFTDNSRFQYLARGDTTWRDYMSGNSSGEVDAVRLIAEIAAEGASGSATGSATFALTREIYLRGGR